MQVVSDALLLWGLFPDAFFLSPRVCKRTVMKAQWTGWFGLTSAIMMELSVLFQPVVHRQRQYQGLVGGSSSWVQKEEEKRKENAASATVG